MEQDDAEAAAGVIVECTDAAKLFSDAMSQGQEIPAEAQACVEEALTEDVMKDFFTATFAQDPELAAEAMAPLEECLAG